MPGDAYDAELLANARPADWTNPRPAPRYNLVVLGGGTAGLVTASGAAALGAKVALVEKNLLGGDCLNVGCVPSKALLRAARFYADLHHAPRFTGNTRIASEADFGAAMERMRRLRAHVSHHDSARRLRNLGVDVFLGEAAFVDRRTVEVDGATLEFKKAAVATGSRAAHPPIEGLEEAGYLTNETVFNLTARPRRLLVIGGGPLGCELAQAFARLGSDVIIANREPYFLPGEERDAAEILADSLRRDGIEVRLNTEVRSATRVDGEKRVRLINDGEEATVAVDEILTGAGRVPNVEGLGLEAAGVEYDLERGRPGERPPADHQPQYLRRGRRGPGAEVYPRGGRHGAYRDPERALLGPQEAELLDHTVVHLHRPRDRPRGHLREGGPGAGLSRSRPSPCP